MASSPVSRLRRCTHSTSIEPFRQNFDFDITKERAQCCVCEVRGPNLWLCLNRDCLTVACGDACRDHSLIHYQRNQEHCVQLNLTTWRMWCYLCECEVVLEREELLPRTPPPLPFRQESDECRAAIADAAGKPCGLTGLQNIGNTCYMNAALQALSNTPPLTQYFLNCCATGGAGPPASQALSRAYHKLVHELWHAKRLGYVPPNGIFYAIRNVHPMFRNYHQHDTQEFLRCFMDQLHEELKVPVLEPPAPHTVLNARHRHSYSFHEKHAGSISSEEVELSGGVERVEGGASSQSEGEEYETCDSGVSERSSLSDEGSNTCSKTSRSLPRTPSPTQEKLRSNLTATSKSYNNRLGSPTRGSHRSHRKQQVKYRSIISDVFDGKLLSSVQCLTCNRISTQVETFQDLSLPIPSRDHLNMLHQSSVNSALAKCSQLYANNDQGWLNWLWVWVCSWFWGPTVGLHDCLSAFFSADELKGDNMYSCEKCNKLRNGVKFSKVLDLPEVLCIHLKRFRHELMFSSKINSYVTFPLDGLDLRPYLHKDCVSEVTSYNLMSVICHHGAAGSGGHYTCYSLNSHTDQWYEFDDQCVTRVSPDTVRSSEAYVLFYRKSGGSVVQHRKRVASLVELTLDHPEPHYFICKQWVNRFKTFAEPGPIDNRDLVCAHGCLMVGPAQAIGTTVTTPIWEYLLDKFGGGPACRSDQAAAVCLLCCQESAARQLATKEHHGQKVGRQEDINDALTCELIHAELLADFKRELDSSLKREQTSQSEPPSLEQVKISPLSDPVQEEAKDTKQPVIADYSQQFWQLYGDDPQTLVSQLQAGTLDPSMRLCPDMECDPEVTSPQTCHMQTEGVHKNFSSTAWQRRKRGSVGYQQAATSGLSEDHIQHLTSAVLEGNGENDAGSGEDEESQDAAHSDSVQCCPETADSPQVTGPILC